MADMQALFASRKKKGKKTGLNFNQVLDAVDTIDAGTTQLVREFDDEGNEVGEAEVVVPTRKVGALTAAANTKNTQPAPAAKKGGLLASVTQAVKFPELAAGEWVDDDEDKDSRAAHGPMLAPGTRGVMDLDGLASQMREIGRSQEALDAEEQSRKEFHWVRKQVLAEADAKAKVAAAGGPAQDEPKEKKTGFYRPREVIAAEADTMLRKEGAAALKELKNDQVFPSLGGGATSASTGAAFTSTGKASVWGVVKEELIQDLAVKQKEGVFLGEHFMPSPEFQGAKPGYMFSKGFMGVGYYWEGPTQEKKEQQQPAHGEPSSSTPPQPVAARAESAQAEAQVSVEMSETAEQKAAREKEEEEREARRRAKKAEKEAQKLEWEQEQQRLKEKEEQEKLEREAAKQAEANAALEGATAEDRFAGLKKKKKKKKDTDADGDD